jgi:hypothetical protein
MAKTRKLLLNIESARLLSRVVFNGIVLADDAVTDSLSRAFVLNAWAVNGVNDISVGLALLPRTLGAAPKSSAEPRFALTLKSAWPDSSASDETVLANFSWEASSVPLVAGQGKEVLKQGVPWDAPIAWSWTKATPVAYLSSDDKESIAALLNRVRAALQERDIASLQKLQTLQISEQALALGESPAEFLGSYANFLQERTAAKDWTALPVNTAALRFLPMASGLLQLVRDKSGRPPIVCTGSAGGFAIEPFVSKINGQWVIVR